MSLPCKFFQLGSCRAGKNCRFSHDRERGRSELVCTFYQHGNCRFGDTCVLQHRKPDAPKKAPIPVKPVIQPQSQNVRVYSETVASSSILPTTSTSYDLWEEADDPARFVNGPNGWPSDYPWEEIPATESTETAPTYSVAITKDLEPGPPAETIILKKAPLCSFSIKNLCRYGTRCRNAHGRQCPNCKLYVLHPLNTEAEDMAHINNCNEASLGVLEEDEDSSQMECTICFDTVYEKTDPRFGLMSCEHCVCLDCVRKWRANDQVETAKACPICRNITYFVFPSTIWLSDPEKKKIALQAYKDKLAEIDCRHFNFGEGSCPFGTSCLYRHCFPNGEREQMAKLRYMQGSDEDVTVMPQVFLADFL